MGSRFPGKAEHDFQAWDFQRRLDIFNNLVGKVLDKFDQESDYDRAMQVLDKKNDLSE